MFVFLKMLSVFETVFDFSIQFMMRCSWCFRYMFAFGFPNKSYHIFFNQLTTVGTGLNAVFFLTISNSSFPLQYLSRFEAL